MKRDTLTGLIARAALDRGYSFFMGEEHEFSGAAREFPAAWLVPPSVVAVTGREEGEITYRVVLHLAALGGADDCGASGGSDGTDESGSGVAGIVGESGYEIGGLWAGLERDARRIVVALASDAEVTAVTGVSCTPARQSLSVHGEESVALKCDVKMSYYF